LGGIFAEGRNAKHKNRNGGRFIGEGGERRHNHSRFQRLQKTAGVRYCFAGDTVYNSVLDTTTTFDTGVWKTNIANEYMAIALPPPPPRYRPQHQRRRRLPGTVAAISLSSARLGFRQRPGNGNGGVSNI
jgi:hypothetical protein